MKHIKYIFLIIGFSLVGCSDLEEQPVGLLAPDGFFQSTDDIQTAVDGALTHAINEKFWGRKLSIALMLRSDMVNLQSTQTRRVEMNDFTTLASNGMLTEFWLKSYQGIAAANQAIAGAADVDLADDIKNPVTAQAYFVRAFYYFHLVRQFGGVPYIDAPVIDAEAAGSISRTPAADVYANIISDLEYAKQWLPNTQASRAIPSKAAASSYLSLVYLTMEQWQDAYDEAKEVIDNKGNYNLDLDTDFQNLFNADVIDGSLEPIFSLDYNNFEARNNGYDQIAPMTGIRGSEENGGGWSVAVPTLAVYDTWPAGDYRRIVSMQEEMHFDDDDNAGTPAIEVPYTNFTISGHEHAANQPYIAKYGRFPGPFARGNARATSHNYSMIRYAEVLLIAAEAAVEIGNDGAAVTYLNQVRARARAGGSWKNTDPSAEPADHPGGVTVNDILEERRFELAFECKRWYDIARRKIGGDVFSDSGLEGAKPSFNADDYLMPLPGDELERNPNLTQNPGY